MSTATEVKEHPILFSGEMVRAILDGRKTQTRRIVKPQPPEGCKPDNGPEWFEPVVIRNGEETEGIPVYGVYDDHGEWGAKCSYGAPGDHLWVRETWYAPACCNQKSPAAIVDGAIDAGYRVTPQHPACGLWYAADGAYRQWGDGEETQGKKRVSIHMPRWASRITLEITGVRVERLNDISEADVRAEGVFPYMIQDSDPPTMTGQFRLLWENINGHGSWDANPWVWVVEFKRI